MSLVELIKIAIDEGMEMDTIEKIILENLEEDTFNKLAIQLQGKVASYLIDKLISKGVIKE